jgi:transketolase
MLDLKAINTIRTLSMDAVQQAESGHPGTPMALAPLAYLLYTRHLRHDPSAPDWFDRDRFVLSVGHASMLLYSTLHLSGYALSLEEIRHFRQWGSQTPGHPEFGHTAGVETTTGPLGQGIANAVGMALTEAHLAAQFNRPGHNIIDHYTWFMAGDGCLMEGISHEAASFAGHQKLGKLIGFYDDNKITIDGSTELSLSDDAALRFTSYGWHVLRVADGNDLDALEAAIAAAKAETKRPTMIIVRTVIGFGSPNRAGTAKAHGEPLGVDEVALAKKHLGWEYTDPFTVPDDALAHFRAQVAERAAAHGEWRARYATYEAAHPELAAELQRRLRGELPAGWDAALPTFDAKSGAVASRAASGAVLTAIAPSLPELLGGSADLTGSNLTLPKGTGPLNAAHPDGRYVYYGVREHAMGAIMNGMALHGGVIPYGGTFLVFADYMRPAIRLAALMGVHVVYVFTHDSIGLGEDGPTHQPVETLTALRCIPNLHVVRPSDATEVADAWRFALTHRGGPVALVLSRQKLAFFERPRYAAPSVLRGAYVLEDPGHGSAQVVLLATGSEVGIAVAASERLVADGIAARVVSAPCLERFATQDAAYREQVLPTGVPRVAVEAGHPMSWYRWVGEHGEIVGLERFGASAPAPVLYEQLGITVDAVVAAARRAMERMPA